MTIIHATPGFFVGRRLYVRRVNEQALAERTLEVAVTRPSGTAIRVTDGGGVANNYGYPAETECVVAVAIDAETVVLYGGRRAANKVTSCGAAGVAGASDLFDGRISDEARKRAVRQSVIARARLAAGRLPETAIARVEVEATDGSGRCWRVSGLEAHRA